MDRITAAEVFVTIVDRGSMIAAAETLEMSRAMVTRYLAQMEQWAGARLLHRTTRKLSLTDAGERTLERCRQMLALAGEIDLVEEGQSDELRGLLRITCSQSLGQTALVGAVAQYLKRHPQVAVDLQMNNRAVNLVEERIDLALRITDRPSPGLIGRQLMRIDHLLCATPHYLAQHGTPQHPHDLAAHSCIYLGETPSDAQWKFRRSGKTVTVNVRGRYAANHTGVRLDAVKQHIGIGSLPYFTARQALDDGEIVQVLPEWDFLSSYHGGLWLLYAPNQYLPPKLRVFIDYLVACLAQEPQLKRLA